MSAWLFHNVGTKISALVLALVVWSYFFAVREGISFTMGTTKLLSEVPVQVLESPLSMLDVRVSPDRVEVVVRGPRDLIGGLEPGDLKVFVEVRGLEKGRYTLPVRIYADGRIAVISRQPETVVAIISDESPRAP